MELGPFITVIASLEVADFSTWHDEYARMHEVREAHGERGRVLYRDLANPCRVVIVFDWTCLADARCYFESDVLRRSVSRARGLAPPRLAYLTRSSAAAFSPTHPAA